MPIELQGYDRIHYTNYVYPWDGRAFLQPPMVDEEYNPAGSYVKEFDLDAGLVENGSASPSRERSRRSTSG